MYKVEIRSQVYNALANIMFETKANKEDMDDAIEWFQMHFWEDAYEEEN